MFFFKPVMLRSSNQQVHGEIYISIYLYLNFVWHYRNSFKLLLVYGHSSPEIHLVIQNFVYLKLYNVEVPLSLRLY